MSIIIFIISLAILILVHEFGHFIVAKKSGIHVHEFGLGFPPKLWGKMWRGTEYTLNAIPFGGFVKIFGEDAHNNTISEEEKPFSFAFKPKWVQALVLVAGVTMNILFAWVLISIGFMFGLPSPVEHEGLGTVRDAHVVIVNTLPGSPADVAGIKSGDSLVSISDGSTTLFGQKNTPEEISNLIAYSTHDVITVVLARGSESQTVVIKPSISIIPAKRAIGVAMDEIGILQLPVHLALFEGARTTIAIVKETAVGLGEFFWHIVTFRADFSQVAGPVGIAGSVSQARTLGFVYILSLVALISINLAVINLVPFPALDGGRLLFVIIEAIIRRPLSPSFVRWANSIGFALLLALMLIVTGHDILRIL